MAQQSVDQRRRMGLRVWMGGCGGAVGGVDKGLLGWEGHSMGEERTTDTLRGRVEDRVPQYV